MDTAVSKAKPDATSPKTPEFRRIYYTFISPTRAFEDLKHRAGWLVPWAILTVCSLASSFVLLQKVNTVEFVRKQIAGSSRADMFEQLPPAQQEQQLQLGARIAEIQTYLYPVISFIAAIIVAAALMAVFNSLFGAAIPFQRSFAIMSYSLLPLAASFLLLLPTVAFSPDPQQLDLAMPMASSPAFFLAPAGNKFLYQLAGGLDIFKIWVVYLLGLGFQVNAEGRRLSRATAVAVTFGMYMLWALTIAAAASIF